MTSTLSENIFGFVLSTFFCISLMSAKREHFEFFLVYLSIFVIIMTGVALLGAVSATV
jgi:hypothetical protein